MAKLRIWFDLNTKEIALISILASLWIVSQIYLGPVISQIIHVHGVTQRLVGWFLMLMLAELTRKFGRVSLMAAIAALATRIVRRSASFYALTVGLGYALAGLTFDILFFLLPTGNLEGKVRKTYILGYSIASGIVALIPYLVFKFSVLGFYGFLALSPKYVYSLAKGTLLSFLGTLIGLSILPQIKVLSTKIRMSVK